MTAAKRIQAFVAAHVDGNGQHVSRMHVDDKRGCITVFLSEADRRDSDRDAREIHAERMAYRALAAEMMARTGCESVEVYADCGEDVWLMAEFSK